MKLLATPAWLDVLVLIASIIMTFATLFANSTQLQGYIQQLIGYFS